MGEGPLFVVGFPRSGTTLLQALLCAHPRIAAPPEMHFVWRIVGLADYYGDLDDDEALRRALHDTIAPPTKGFEVCEFDEDRLFARVRKGPRTYAALLDGVLSDLAERQGKQRWCEKTPEQSAGAALALFPDARIIHIVRNPRDVVASGINAPYETRSAEQLAKDWRRFTLETISTGASAGPRRYLQVRYEDLAADPEAVLRLVCTFIDEAFDRGMIDPAERQRSSARTVLAPHQARALATVEPTRPGAHSRSLSPRARARVSAVVAGELGALGYPPARRGAVLLGRALGLSEVVNGINQARTIRNERSRGQTPADRHRDVQRQIRATAERVYGDAGGAMPAPDTLRT